MRQKTVTEKYRAVLEGKMAKSEFVRQMRQQYPMHVTQFNGFDDSVQILKNRGLLFEAPAEKKAKVYDERPALPYSDDALQRGIRYELEAAGIAAHDAFNIKLEDFDKAKKKAEDNLMKDPMHYLNLVSGESSKVDKHDKEVPVKRGERKVDVFNGMKKANLREGLSPEKLKKLGDRLGIKDPVKLQQIIDKFSSGEKDQVEKDATKKTFGEGLDADFAPSPNSDIPDANAEEYDVATAFKKAKVDMSKPVTVIHSYGAAYYASENVDEMSAEAAIKKLEAERQDRSKQYTDDGEKVPEDHHGYEFENYSVLEEEMPEGHEYKFTYFQTGDASYSITQEKSNMNEEDDIPFKKVYQADFDELKKFLLNKTSASHDAHVLDGVFHELFESAENLVDEQPGTSEIDAIFAVAENLAEHYEENGEDEEAAIAEDVLSIIKPIAMASENKVEEAPSGLEEVMVAALRKGFNEEQIVDAVNRIRERKNGVQTNEASQEESVADYIIKHYTNPKTGKSLVDDEIVSDFFKTHPEWEQQADGTEEGMEELIRNFGEYLDANYEGSSDMAEKKGKDHDGDGDIDSDDYMAAKDKAIKKAMGKDEQLKEAIKGIIRKSLLSEAATNRLSDVGDKYGDYKGMQVVVNDLENIVTDVESFFAKTRERIQGAFDKIGNIETPDGMKVGAFLAPGIADALFKDLVPVRRLTKKDINLPQTNFIKADPVAEVGIEEEPKQTVFSPVNEKK